MNQHCPNCGKFVKDLPHCTKKNPKDYGEKFTAVNLRRTKQERKIRYCFLRSIGCNRLLARRLAAWSDEHQALFITNNFEPVR